MSFLLSHFAFTLCFDTFYVLYKALLVALFLKYAIQIHLPNQDAPKN